MIDYAMELGLYYGINLELGSCKDCGFEGSIFSTCPKCSSTNVSGITRCCGYLGNKIKDGETRYNKGKDAEVDNRVRHFDIEVK
jgi:ribonucleoside-triphosphate reductase